MKLQLDKKMPFEKKVKRFNDLTQQLYDWLGVKHPTLNIQLVPIDKVKGNDYNPNKVAPPEMKLLQLSMEKDGVTMPVVACKTKEGYTVVDGFHRRTVAKKSKKLAKSLKGFLPISRLDKDLEDRIASTVRHNLARGTHQVELSAELVITLRKHNWDDERIAKGLGMDAEEVLRLKQVTGLAEAFADKDFSNSWK